MNDAAIRRLLLTCLQVDGLHENGCLCQISPNEWDQLLSLAQQQGITPLLYYRLDTNGGFTAAPTSVTVALQNAYYRNSVRNLRLYRQLETIVCALQVRNISTIVLKGASLAVTVYPNPALRTMNDIDLLVKPAQMADAVAVMAELGYRFIEETGSPVLGETDLVMGHHLPRFVKADEVAAVELHWRLASPDRYQPFDDDALWARAVAMPLATATTCSLCPTDQLLHICLHASYHHAFQQGIRCLCDIDALVRRAGPAIDWSDLQRQTEEQQWGPGVYLALYLAHELLAVPLPNSVLQQATLLVSPSQMPEIAQWHIFSAQQIDEPIPSPAFTKLWDADNWHLRIRVFVQRIFLPKQIIARLYGVSLDSPRIYGWYIRHYIGVVKRYAHHLWRLNRRDTRALTAARQRMQLSQWLGQDDNL
jgi:hypothetical protein